MNEWLPELENWVEIRCFAHLWNTLRTYRIWEAALTTCWERRLASHRTPAVKKHCLAANRRQSLALRQALDPHYHHKQNSGQSMSKTGKAFSAIPFFALLLTRDLSVLIKLQRLHRRLQTLSLVLSEKLSLSSASGWFWPTKIDSGRVFSQNCEIPNVKSLQFFVVRFRKRTSGENTKGKTLLDAVFHPHRVHYFNA